MLLPKFDFHEPATMEEACQIMAELGKKAKPLAGGTDLIVNMKKGVVSPENLVSLGRIGDLKEMGSSNGFFRIGACLTAAELAESDEISKVFGALGRGAGSLGSPLIRNLATVGGNLVSARPAADMPPPLMAYGARAVLRNSKGEREVPLTEFFKGPGETAMEKDELLAEIRLERPPDGSGAGYFKLGVREALEISLVNAAAFLTLNPDGSIKTARVVLGSVAPTPLRAPSAEDVLAGEKPSQELFAKAGEAAARDSKPIDDFRASAEYKRAMVEVMSRRALSMALAEAQG
jgi:aerobic carbon-monoxide dehydrogenase medium subunit